MAKAARQPAGQQRSAGLRNAQCLWFAATIAAGAIAAWSVSPWVFRAFPTDLTRTRVILDTLADSTSAPPIVVFGSSIAMASVDMERLAPPSAEGIVGWNLASTGQTPLESYLYYQELPTDVEIIVQTLSVSTLNHGGVLDAQKYNAFYMYGYRPDTRTRESMSETLGASMAALFAKSAGRHRFESRWVLRQAADWWMRNLLRTDLRIDRAMTDLVFPNSGAKEVPLTAIRAQFERSMRSGPSVFRGHPNKFAFLQAMVRRAQDQGREIVFVLLPIHPENYKYRGEQYFKDARRRLTEFGRANGVAVLDGIDVVPAENYVDTVHPSERGAVVFSDWLARQLKQLRHTPVAP